MRRVALAAVLFACACKKPVEEAPFVPTASPVETGPAAVKARRPTTRYYLGRTTTRCEVYAVDGEVFSAPFSTPCPLDLFPGERIRIAGRTCMRESSDATRALPVVCPDPLTNYEKERRGELPASTPPRE